MKIKNITVKNFRLLESICVALEDDITLIVGKNNSGKTSFFEAIKILTTGDEKLSFEDVTQSTYAIFKEASNLYSESKKSDITEEEKQELEIRIQNTIPKIELIIEIEYDKTKDSLIELSEFITDLDDTRNDATILLSYEPRNSLGLFNSFFNRVRNSLGLFNSFFNRVDTSIELIKYLKEHLTTFYKLSCYA